VRDVAALVVLATAAARAGARVHRDGLGRVQQVTTKSSATDLVTEVDRDAERAIVDAIVAARPDDAILGEEATPRTSGVRWIVDPLDGTTNYVYRYPAYGVSIRLEIDGALAAGVVHDSAATASIPASSARARRARPSDRGARSRRPRDRALATGFQPQPALRAWQAGVLTRPAARARRPARRLGRDRPLRRRERTARHLLRGGPRGWDTAAGTAIARAGRSCAAARPTPPHRLVVAAARASSRCWWPRSARRARSARFERRPQRD
jgi:myo-inositol-1(or 4)-monophosphatase